MPSILKRGETSYRLTVCCGYDKQGKKIRKYKTIDLSDIKPNKREAEAQRQWILFKEEIEKGSYLDAGKITFEDFIEKWLKDYAEPTLAPKTLFRYKELLNTRIIPALGHIKLNKLQPTHLTEFYNNLREKGVRMITHYAPKENFNALVTALGFSSADILKGAEINYRTLNNIKAGKTLRTETANKICTAMGIDINLLFIPQNSEGTLSERTISHHHRLISSILTWAVQWGFLLNNPAARVRAPKFEKKEARHYDVAQTQYILDLIENEPIKYRAMINLAIYGGMRMGELSALEWDNINFDTGILKINKALQYLPDEGTFVKSTKNESSERSISLPENVIYLLREYKLWQNSEKAKLGDLWNEDCKNIFTSNYGNPIFPHTISKWFLKFIRKHNNAINEDTSIKKEDKSKYLLDEVNFHGLRHTSATILISQGVDVTTVSKRLGHAKTSTTTDIYSHSLKKADMEASNKLGNLFNKAQSEKKQG